MSEKKKALVTAESTANQLASSTLPNSVLHFGSDVAQGLRGKKPHSAASSTNESNIASAVESVVTRSMPQPESVAETAVSAAQGLQNGEKPGDDRQTLSLAIPDRCEIHPRRPISLEEINEVLQRHRGLLDLPRMALSIAFDIGFKLRCWRDVIPHGQSLPWIKANIPAISERTVQVYIQLWDHNEVIRAKLLNPQTTADLEVWPTIEGALALIKKPCGPKEHRVCAVLKNKDARDNSQPTPIPRERLVTKVDQWCECSIPRLLAKFNPSQHRDVLCAIQDFCVSRMEKLTSDS
jgi:hypothetical protein